MQHLCFSKPWVYYKSDHPCTAEHEETGREGAHHRGTDKSVLNLYRTQRLGSCRNLQRTQEWKRYKEKKTSPKNNFLPEEGEADILIVWRLDRLTRSIIDFQKILERVGPQIVSITESVDMTTAAGRLVANVLVAFAQYQREQISENTVQGLEEAKEKGKQIGRPPKIPEEIRHQILRLRKRGYTFKEISEKTGTKYNTVKRFATVSGYNKKISLLFLQNESFETIFISEILFCA